MLFGYTVAETQLDYALLEAFLALLGDGQQGGRDRVGGGGGGGASKLLVRDTAFSLPAFDLGSGC